MPNRRGDADVALVCRRRLGESFRAVLELLLGDRERAVAKPGQKKPGESWQINGLLQTNQKAKELETCYRDRPTKLPAWGNPWMCVHEAPLAAVAFW